MEEIEEKLRAKAIASMSISGKPNPKPKTKSINPREEGELSSSEDEDASQSTNTAAPLQAEADPTASKNVHTQSSNAGKCLSANGPSSSVDLQVQMPVPQNYSKHFEMNPVPSKSSNHHTPGWYVTSEANDNLVISFSDDDTGSDSEEHKVERTESKDTIVRVDGYKRPMASSHIKSKILQHQVNNQIEMMPKKISSSSKFVSHGTKIRGHSSRVLGASSFEREPHIQRHNSLHKTLASRKRRYIRGENSTDNELESLRQKIAIRENELKLQSKPMPQSKEMISGSYGDYHDSKAVRTSKQASVSIEGLPLKEPEKKHLKLDESSDSKVNANGQLLVSAKESTSEIKKQVLGDSDHLKGRNMMDCIQYANGNAVGTTDPIIDKRQGKENGQGSYCLFGPGNSASSSRADDTPRQVHSFPLLNTTSGLTQMKSSAEDRVACRLEMPSLMKSCSEELNQNEIISGDRMLLLTSGDNLKTCDLSLQNGSFSTYLDDPNLLGQSSMDMQSLANMEELLDKELEEAQELRRKCEVEERSALRTYRKAQRALVDANERSSYLYRKRELFSARLRAFIMEESSSLWSSRWHNHRDTGLDSLNNIPKANMLPSLSYRMQAEREVLDQVGYESKGQCTDHTLNTSYRPMKAPNLGTDPCSEPDGSTSDQLQRKDNSAINGVFTPSNQPNMSADEDEGTFPFDQKAVQSRLVCENKEENLEERGAEMNRRSEIKSSSENSQDFALLEASLRSELFARIGMRNPSKNSGLDLNREPTAEKGAEIDSKKTHINAEKLSTFPNQPLLEADHKQMANMKGTERSGRKNCHPSTCDPCHCDKPCFDSGSRKSPIHEESSSSLKDSYRPMCSSVFSLPCSVLKIVFRHPKDILLSNCKGYQFSNNHQEYPDGISHEKTVNLSRYESLLGFFAAHATHDSYTCDLAIDPFWPHCMFELRGKCNDDECSWQHVKDYTQRNSKLLNDSASSDGQSDPSSALRKFTNAHGLSRCLRHYITPVPTYQIGSNLIKADRHSSGYVLAPSIWQYWQRSFCTSFSLPFSVQRSLPTNVPSLLAGDGCVEDQKSGNRLSSYFRSHEGTMKQIMQGLADSEQSLELALDLFNGSINKQEGKKKALAVLSRSLEVDPNSVVLWIAYLHIYYRKEKVIGKDDMFLLAVQHNEGSYELWLMYINSRLELGDRLVAYDTALSTLSRIARAPNKDIKYSSACITDLSLQMLDFLRMSGDVEKAISRIYGLLPSTMDFDNSSDTLLLDIFACLTISDKCILWVCCVYLVMYKKLPDEVLGHFELEQETLFGIEWPSTQLKDDEKYCSIKLMEMAVDTVAVGMDGDSYERTQLQKTALRPIHSLAVSHIRCVAALEDIDSTKNLLAKYIKLYPTCIELVLTSACLQKVCLGDVGFKGFEEALCNWPEEIPGIQCIWNQYAEHVLENAKVSLAEELMTRWYQSVWKGEGSQNRKLNVDRQDCLYSPSKLPFSNPEDELFGLINLSLHSFLLKNQVEARSTIDKALKVASGEDFKHCVKEHAAFLLSDGSDLIKDTHSSKILSLLIGYLMDARAFPASEPLSRNFYKTIKKPRVRQLINNLLGPVSMDSSLMNSILEVWYGPSLLPENFDKFKDLVDFVEALMEILPANYRLALSVCKLTQNFNYSAIVSATTKFWAGSLLVNSICQAFPVASEQIWIEAADVLGKLEIQDISEKFHQHAVSVYPFSIELCQSYLKLSKITGNVSSILEAAKERGLEAAKERGIQLN
ncbi:zinc finger C3H1 domain protein isoform X2 [Tasmannia lanceolata]|uniref:zinc finger C3H1 domain protein isoform X2 n=1 Tax=Tasmannia lanceolata TaxID=3420 RepID=UPI0040649DBC